jgi:DNA-3-methyladenine glycosylase I
MSVKRCDWAEDQFDEYVTYHDEEWGVPVHEDQVLFEFLILEGAQAGLSWSTILKRREGYRQSFGDFDPEKVAQFDENKIQELLQFEGIIRNKLKVRSAVANAQKFLEIQNEFGSFDAYVWEFVGGEPIINHWESMKEVPANTAESDALAKDLKKRGFKFVGSTIMYAYMQACGLVMDHTKDCFRYEELTE